MEWDTAAGHAILKTAGGVVLDYNLKSLEYGKKIIQILLLLLFPTNQLNNY